MLKSITLTQHCTIEKWDELIVAVPDDMDDETIQKWMHDLREIGEIELDEEEYHDDGELSIDISDAPPAATAPHLTLTENGPIDEETTLTAFTTVRLQAELERRRAKESEGERPYCNVTDYTHAR
jgi:hypothetical protein